MQLCGLYIDPNALCGLGKYMPICAYRLININAYRKKLHRKQFGQSRASKRIKKMPHFDHFPRPRESYP